MNINSKEMEIIVIKGAIIISMAILAATVLNASLAWVILSS